MNFGKVALLAVLPFALLPIAARAQTSVYATVTAHNLGGLTYTTVGTGTANTLTTKTDGSFSPLGATIGGYYDFKSIGRIRLGADVRGSITRSNHGADPTNAGSGGRIYTAMGGVRATFPAHFKLLAPYLQGSVGYARTDAGISPAVSLNQTNPFPAGRATTSSGVVYQGLAGLDIRALPTLDVRLFEFGLGAISGIQNQPGAHLLQSVSVGLVYHLPF